MSTRAVPAWVTLRAAVGALSLALPAFAGPEFRVSFPAQTRDEPATGRLVVWLVRANSPVDIAGRAPAEGPFFESPEPMFGIDVKDLAPGAAAIVDDRATSFPVKLSQLPPGRYKAQAVLDMRRLDSSWRREPGNLCSQVHVVDLAPDARIDISLTEVVRPEPPSPARGVEYVEVPSRLLTEFRGYPVTLKAGVVLPTGYEPGGARKYAAVYEVPGFGADHHGAGAVRYAGAFADVLRECFWITLNPEGPNGHHLFANSANNGPVGDALVSELIPALEKKYPLKAEAHARMLRGHSSGGWASIWLALNYPETFGAAWASSPDPVDFRRFQLPCIYTSASMYAFAGGDGGSAGREIPSYRDTGVTRMTIRQENRMEEVLGPNNTSGQQWDSWMAVFGPRDKDGNPAALYDPETGIINRAVAESFRAYDIADLVRKDPRKYATPLIERVRIIVGGEDNYFLEAAVAGLKRDVETVRDGLQVSNPQGYIKIVPGLDHSTIYASPEMRAIPQEILAHLKRLKD